MNLLWKVVLYTKKKTRTFIILAQTKELARWYCECGYLKEGIRNTTVEHIPEGIIEVKHRCWRT